MLRTFWSTIVYVSEFKNFVFTYLFIFKKYNIIIFFYPGPQMEDISTSGRKYHQMEEEDRLPKTSGIGKPYNPY